MAIGLLMGIGVGLALDNIALGIGVGIVSGVALGFAFSKRELVRDKKTRRRISWTMLSVSILGCLLFGYIIGDIALGVTAGIGFSFEDEHINEELTFYRTHFFFLKDYGKKSTLNLM